MVFSTFFTNVITPVTQAATISGTTPISFGTIIVESDDITIEIDARNGAASPHIGSGGLGYVSGGSSGTVTVNSDIPGQFIILSYPNSVQLKFGINTMTLDGITSRSQQNATSNAVGDINFYIGGLLHVSGGQVGNTYSENITVLVTVNNP